MQMWPSSGFSRVPRNPASRPRSFISHRWEPRASGGEGRVRGAGGGVGGGWAAGPSRPGPTRTAGPGFLAGTHRQVSSEESGVSPT